MAYIFMLFFFFFRLIYFLVRFHYVGSHIVHRVRVMNAFCFIKGRNNVHQIFLEVNF